MIPYYQDDAVTIYHGDCREIVTTLGCFELLLTDPPYGLSKKWTGGNGWQVNRGNMPISWDEKTCPDALNLAISVCKNQIIWGGHLYTLPISRCWLVWDKSQKMPTVGDVELDWTSFDKPPKSFTESRNPEGIREHPTQKPQSLIQWCIGIAGDVQMILDPFMGSGTTLRAAKNLGRKAIGIEIEEKYCEIAAKRMAQEVLQL